MDISEADFEAANRRAAQRKATFPGAVAVRYDKRSARIVITLASDLQLAFSPRRAQGAGTRAAG